MMTRCDSSEGRYDCGCRRGVRLFQKLVRTKREGLGLLRTCLTQRANMLESVFWKIPEPSEALTNVIDCASSRVAMSENNSHACALCALACKHLYIFHV